MGSSATSTEITDPEKQCDLNHLIIVCCHAIYLGPPSANIMDSSTTIASSRPDELPSSSEANWLIEPFQRGEIATYVGHIEAGIRALAADKHAILVFSGGATKPEKTERTEADSYLVSGTSSYEGARKLCYGSRSESYLRQYSWILLDPRFLTPFFLPFYATCPEAARGNEASSSLEKICC